MSFASPLVLVALLGIPLVVALYVIQQRQRQRSHGLFVAAALTESVAPERPRWRRHVPVIVFAVALTVMILAAARPQLSSARPVSDGAVMLVDDVSGSMQATDVAPSRERAARRAGARFIAAVPTTVQVGVMEFARTPAVLQSPTSDHAAAQAALARPPRFSGGTAVGEAIQIASNTLHGLPKIGGKRRPGAIVVISDGASNVGIDPIITARRAAAMHIPVFTVSVGTTHGVVSIRRGASTVRAPVPVDRRQLAEIARVSGGQAFRAADASGVSAAYERLAARLGTRVVEQEITTDFAGLAIALLLLGGVASLLWFGRLA
jgi:Ca-activated chloride channel family protein